MEFQAIVMAGGRGSRMMEVTSELPKCLLPVGNLPVIRSCVNRLQNFQVKSCIVLVPESDKSKVQEALENKYDLKIDIIGIPKNDDWGTANSLRYIHDKIHSDVLIVSCDMVTNFDLKKMANFHRKHDSSLTMLLAPLPKNLKDAPVPGHKGKNKPEKDIIAFDKNGRLVLFNSAADFEDGVPLKFPVMEGHSDFQVYSNLVDMHLYMMKKSLVDYIIQSKQISTIKGEFLPVIVSKQFSKHQGVSTVPVVTNGQDVDNYEDLKSLALQLSSFNNYDNSLETSYCCDPLKCFAYVEKESFSTRVNTLVAFLETNRQISKNLGSAMGVSNKPSGYPKSQVDNDSIVGDECQLMVKSSIKVSVVGSSCSFGEKAKVTNSVLMDNVSIQSGSTIQGSIICSNVNIGSNCELKNCVISPGQTIEDGTKLNNEVVQGAYHLMEI